MKLNKIVLGVALAMGITSFAQAATSTDQGSGKVTFHGYIVDAPCSIASNKDQTVEMNQITNTLLADGGTSPAKDFSIELEKCNLTDKNGVTVTFTGAAGVIPGSLGMSKVSGASIIINDGASKQVKLGEATTLQTLANGNNSLNFSAMVKGNPGETVTLGEFTSAANFTLSYQ